MTQRSVLRSTVSVQYGGQARVSPASGSYGFPPVSRSDQRPFQKRNTSEGPALRDVGKTSASQLAAYKLMEPVGCHCLFGATPGPASMLRAVHS